MTPLSVARALAAVGCLAASMLAPAQPSSGMKILVGFPVGGAPDAVARAYAEQLRGVVGGAVLIDNRTGASGKIAIDALLAAAADGQTLALIPASALHTVPMTSKAARYDSLRDFVAIGSVAEYGFGVSAGPTSGAQDLNAFKAWGARQAKPVGFATPGPGTPQHFIGAQMQKLLDLNMIHVPYRGGAAAIGDVMSGEVPILITTEQLLVPHEGQGKLKLLFITSPERNVRLPNVPTARELGLAQLEQSDWFGIFVKSGTPPAKVEELRAQLGKVLASQGYRDSMKTLGYGVPSQQPTNFSDRLQSERAVWAERVKIAGFEAPE
jgi:tripartite-type tricarboxylate transporter receptor subunit TctC